MATKNTRSRRQQNCRKHKSKNDSDDESNSLQPHIKKRKLNDNINKEYARRFINILREYQSVLLHNTNDSQFIEIKLYSNDKSYSMVTGQIGTIGRKKVKYCGTKQASLIHAVSILIQKVHNGYTLIDDENDSSDSDMSDIGVFDNYHFSLSGTFSMRQSAFENLITENDGKIDDVPNQNTDFLVIRDKFALNDTKKCNFAKRSKIPIITESFVLDSIKNNALPDSKSYIIRVILLLELPLALLHSICDFLSLTTLIDVELSCKALYAIASNPKHIKKSFCIGSMYEFYLAQKSESLPRRHKTEPQLFELYKRHWIHLMKLEMQKSYNEYSIENVQTIANDKSVMSRPFRLANVKQLLVANAEKDKDVKYIYPLFAQLQKLTVYSNGFIHFRFFCIIPHLSHLSITSLPCEYNPMSFIRSKLINMHKLLHLELNTIAIDSNDDLKLLGQMTQLQRLKLGQISFMEGLNDAYAIQECFKNWTKLQFVKLFSHDTFEQRFSGYTAHPFECMLIEACVTYSLETLEALSLFMVNRDDSQIKRWISKTDQYNKEIVWYMGTTQNNNGKTYFPNYQIWKNKPLLCALKHFECILSVTDHNIEYYCEICDYLQYINTLESVKITHTFEWEEHRYLNAFDFGTLLSTLIMTLLHKKCPNNIDNNINQINYFGTVELFHFPKCALQDYMERSFWNQECMNKLRNLKNYCLETLSITMEDCLFCSDYMEMRAQNFIKHVTIGSLISHEFACYKDIMVNNGFECTDVGKNWERKIRFESIDTITSLQELHRWQSQRKSE